MQLLDAGLVAAKLVAADVKRVEVVSKVGIMGRTYPHCATL